MKKGLIFATTLAMALGVGVAVGAHQKPAAEVKAWSGSECGDSWYVIGTINGQNWDSWNPFVLNGDRYEYVIDDDKQVEFKLTNTNSWSGIQINAAYGSDLDWNGKGWTSLTTKNGENFKTQTAGKYTIYYDKNITDYENGVWAFGIEEYEEPATTYAVTCVLDGKAQTPVQVAEGELPAAPAAQWGKSFSGWCSDEGCTIPASGVTAATTVYGKFTTLPTVTYTIDASKVSTDYAALYLWAWEPNGLNNAQNWPGVVVAGNTITLPNDASFLINNGDNGHQTVNVTQSLVANDTLRILADVDGEGHNEVVWQSTVDEPAEDGYYLVGSKTNFKFKNATKMSTTGIAAENVAELMNYPAKQDEKIKVRGFFRNDADPNKWSFYDGGAKDFGDIDDDANFVFSKDQPVDIFAKWVKISEEPEQWELKFYVTAHAERYDISIYDVLFEGKRLASTSEEPHVARATEGVNFEYELPDMNGYYARGLYTDAACTVEYVPTKYNADATLYAKYTRLGEYMTGDATYSGSEALAWNVDGATYLSSVVNDPNNRLEGSVTIPASASKEHPVAVKALRYIGDAIYYEEEVEKHTQWEGVTYTLGAEYSFVSLDKDSNLSFTKGGTFAVYINQENKIFLNEGAAAFYTKFLTDTGAVCKTDNTTDPVRLGEVWEELEGVYASLSSEEKSAIRAVGFNGGDEKGDDLHKVMARYAYIVTKYGSVAFENFIFPEADTIEPHPNMVMGGLDTFVASDNTTMIIVISIVAVSALAFTMLLVFKKRKQK